MVSPQTEALGDAVPIGRGAARSIGRTLRFSGVLVGFRIPPAAMQGSTSPILWSRMPTAVAANTVVAAVAADGFCVGTMTSEATGADPEPAAVTGTVGDMGVPTSRDQGGSAMPYLPGLDGIRALAIVGVLLYHADIEWLPGGFLGVEVFFVVSGYLITLLLLGEHERTGRIDLRSFWVRRARRLLPALAFYLAGSLGLAALFAPDVIDEWRAGVWAALLYVANWFGVFSEVSYAEGFGRKSFLHHLWSLGVEEQFYLVWPVLLFAMIKVVGRRVTWLLIAAGVAGSVALTWHLYQPLEDPIRVYYGTDTRASGLLLGAGLAFVWQPWRWSLPRRRHRAAVGAGATVLGVGGLVGVVWAMTRYDIVLPNADATFRWGLLVTAALAAAAIAGVTPAASPLAKLSALPPVRWIGTRSYGIYLWHWPIFQITRERLDVELEGTTLLLVRLALTACAAEVSFQLIEQPFRRRAGLAQFGRMWRSGWHRLGVAQLVGAAVAAVAVLQLMQVPQTAETDVVVTVAAEELALPAPTATPLPTPSPTPTPLPDPIALPPSADAAPTEAPTATPTATPEPEPVGFETVTFVGDSVMEGAAIHLAELVPGAEIDTRVGRHWFQASEILDELEAEAAVGDAVVLHLGNNGPIDEELFDEVVGRLRNVELVVVVNVRVPVRWEGSVNEALAAGAERWENVELVDWYDRSNEKPKFFAADGVHLTDRGRRSYARAIALALGIDPDAPSPPPPSGPAPGSETPAATPEPSSSEPTPPESPTDPAAEAPAAPPPSGSSGGS